MTDWKQRAKEIAVEVAMDPDCAADIIEVALERAAAQAELCRADAMKFRALVEELEAAVRALCNGKTDA